MRTCHLYLYGIAAATVALVAFAPANAQDVMTEDPGSADMMQPDMTKPLTPEQEAERATWPADRQASYDAWPDDAKSYYWSLSPERQDIFWRMRDEDKVAITRMNRERQEASWKAIEQRMPNPPADG